MTSSSLFAMRYLGLLSALFLLAGCEHTDPLGADGNGLQPTLRSLQENIFSTSCAVSGCHAGPAPQQGLNLSAGQSFANLVGVPSREMPTLDRVAPGDPEGSYLVWKIEGRAGIVGARMPLGRPALSADAVAAVRQWIADGAEDN